MCLSTLMPSLPSADDFEDECALVVGLEGVFLGAQLVEHAAEGPYVAFFVVGLLLAHFWRKLLRRADHGMGEVGRVLQQLRNAQVADTYVFVLH